MYRFGLGEAAADQPTPATGAQFIDEAHKIVQSITLAQNDNFPDMRANVDADGDFIVTDVYGTSTGPYAIQFRNAAGRNLSTAAMSNANAIGTAQFPVPFGGVPYPAAGQISFAIQNKHAGANTIELVLSGVKRRRV